MLARSRERSRNFSTRRIYIYVGPYFLIAIFNARKENNARGGSSFTESRVNKIKIERFTRMRKKRKRKSTGSTPV